MSILTQVSKLMISTVRGILRCIFILMYVYKVHLIICEVYFLTLH